MNRMWIKHWSTCRYASAIEYTTENREGAGTKRLSGPGTGLEERAGTEVLESLCEFFGEGAMRTL